MEGTNGDRLALGPQGRKRVARTLARTVRVNEDLAAREAAHEHALAIIAAEKLDGWLADPAKAVGGRFYILADGRTFERVCVEWEEAGPADLPGATAWRAKRHGWQFIPAGELANLMGVVFELIWKSSKEADGWANGAELSEREIALLRLAAGSDAITALQSSPPYSTIWDRWAAGG